MNSIYHIFMYFLVIQSVDAQFAVGGHGPGVESFVQSALTAPSSSAATESRSPAHGESCETVIPLFCSGTFFVMELYTQSPLVDNSRHPVCV